MDHRTIRAQLSAYRDGELPADARRDVEAHLSRCTGCREEAKRLEAFSRAMRDAVRTSDDEAFVSRVMEDVDRLHRTPRRAFELPRWFRIPEWAFPELGLGLAVIAFLLVMPPQQATGMSVEEMLLSDVSQSAKWLFETAPADEMADLGFRWEEL